VSVEPKKMGRARDGLSSFNEGVRAMEDLEPYLMVALTIIRIGASAVNLIKALKGLAKAPRHRSPKSPPGNP
jgi:hypothetical protein